MSIYSSDFTSDKLWRAVRFMHFQVILGLKKDNFVPEISRILVVLYHQILSIIDVKKFALSPQPIGCKSQTSRTKVTGLFPRLR